ncbi:MAG TPA: hypothetical protein VGE07_14905 [Herpetosiphonaceae bacterium]
MDTTIMLILGVGVLLTLVFGSRALLRYWEGETNMSDDDYAFDRRVASYNDLLANRRRDDEIVRILGGQELPTVSERWGPSSDEDDDDEYEDDDEEYEDDDEDDEDE